MGCLPKFSKFLCCITLETGGLIIGWLATIFSAIILGYAVIFMVILIIAHNDGTLDLGLNDDASNIDVDSGTVFLVAMVVFAILIIYGLVVFIASILLIKATRKRNHSNMMPFMILMVIGVVVNCIQVVGSTGAGTLVFAILFVLVEIYFFLCIYSLYDMFRNERRLGEIQPQVHVSQPFGYGQRPQQPYPYPQQSPAYGRPAGYPTFQQQNEQQATSTQNAPS